MCIIHWFEANELGCVCATRQLWYKQSSGITFISLNIWDIITSEKMPVNYMSLLCVRKQMVSHGLIFSRSDMIYKVVSIPPKARQDFQDKGRKLL